MTPDPTGFYGLEPGDAVTLRGGSRVMTILIIGELVHKLRKQIPYDDGIDIDTRVATCSWHKDDGEPMQKSYPTHALIKVEIEEKT